MNRYGGPAQPTEDQVTVPIRFVTELLRLAVRVDRSNPAIPELDRRIRAAASASGSEPRCFAPGWGTVESARKAAQLLGLVRSARTITTWATRGIVRAYRIGARAWVVYVPDVIERAEEGHR